MSNSKPLLFVAKWISLGFGSGLAPKAPGTFGTLVGIPFVFLFAELTVIWYLFVTGLFFLLGVWAAHYYSDHLGEHDHSSIVWDEVVGYMITMAFVPLEWSWVVLGFVLFRLFDIWKPWPIRLLDKHVHGGFGVMIDDALAGVYAAVTLLAIQIIITG